VCHGGLIDVDVVFIVESKELYPGELRAVSMIMEFETPKRWTMSRKNSTTCSDLIVEIG